MIARRKETRFTEADIDDIQRRFEAEFEGVQPGQIILVSHEGSPSEERGYALMRYERHETEIELDNVYRLHRGMRIGSISGLMNSLQDQPRVWDTDRLKGNIFSSATLKFVYDPEFDTHWPTAWHPDVFVPLVTRFSDGHVERMPYAVGVVSDIAAIRARLSEIVRPVYMATVIEPFLQGLPTRYRPPRWHLKTWAKLVPGLWADYARAAKNVAPGGFMYIGCKEEVFLLGVAKNADGSIFWQGTYTASTKPPLYFTNTGLDHSSPREHTFTSDVFDCGWWGAIRMSFDKKVQQERRSRFICPQMGRKQNCKYTTFTGQPELITGDLQKALSHFATTDFAEYADVVKEYAERIRVPHPTLEPSGSYGFYI